MPSVPTSPDSPPALPAIRPYRPADRPALHDICVRTGLSGGDATGHYRDPEILPFTFAAPYAELEPELTFVVDDGEGAVGYVLGTADTPAFVEAFRERWLPVAAERFPLPDESADTPDDHLVRLLHRPERMLVPEVAAYPAHLHIDLLPAYQGRGLGRRLMHTLWDALRTRGVSGVHLAMSPENTGARAFYDRLGFHEIPVGDALETVHYLGYLL